jgi:hypothetical protein
MSSTDQHDNQLPPPPPPPRTRRTHTSDRVTAALRNLPHDVKVKKNKEIGGRNAERELRRVQHQEQPLTHEEAPDDESLITVSDTEETLLPASMLHGALSKLSPTSGKALPTLTLYH